MTPRIPVAGPWITDREIDYVREAATTNWYGNSGEFVGRFERAFARYVDRRFAVALPSCTSAIHLVLAALGIGPGDEVIVPDVTWIASAAPITYVGAVPVFADIDHTRWCLATDSARAAVSSRTKAIVAVDLYGSMPALDELTDLAEAHGVALIEDAAEAVGSRYRGRPAGSFGLASVFSFHGSKTLTTGEGGMLVTDDAALHERVLALRDHGRPPNDVAFRNSEVAFKYKMSAIQAALGLAQLERVDELVDRKHRIFGWYRDRLGAVPGITLNDNTPPLENSFWMVTVVLDPALCLPKETVQAELFAQGIDCRPFFSPLSSLPAYAGAADRARAAAANQLSYGISPWGVNLPSALVLTEAEVDRVCRVFVALCERASGAGA